MIVLLITVYQRIVSPALRQVLGIQIMCRFTPSCSEYAKRMIKKHGSWKGSWLGFVRLLQCQPFSSQKSKVENQNFNAKVRSLSF